MRKELRKEVRSGQIKTIVVTLSIFPLLMANLLSTQIPWKFVKWSNCRRRNWWYSPIITLADPQKAQCDKWGPRLKQLTFVSGYCVQPLINKSNGFITIWSRWHDLLPWYLPYWKMAKVFARSLDYLKLNTINLKKIIRSLNKSNK